MNPAKMNSKEILSLISTYHSSSIRRLHLIPSENSLSMFARIPFLTDIIHRYCFIDSGDNFAWPGNSILESIESNLMVGLRDIFNARYVNVKPVSGINCMLIALSALSELNGTIISIEQSDGGHASTQYIGKKLGLNCIFLPFDSRRFDVDLDKLSKLIELIPGPKLIYVDQSMCLFPINLKAIRSVIDENTKIHYDGSHVMGLIAGGVFQDPLKEGADCFGGSTHKTFPGPHKGILLTDSEAIARKIDESAEHWVSNHHMADVASLAITVADFSKNHRSYAIHTVGNAQALGGFLTERGFTVCAKELGFTKSHQLWIDIAPLIDPMHASQILLAAGIVVNAIEIPYLESKIGLRIGVQEITHAGMRTDAMAEIAEIFRRLLICREDPQFVGLKVQELICAYRNKENEDAIESLLAGVTNDVLA